MENNKTHPNNEPENSAQSLLRRLNSHYDPSKVASEKKGMASLDSVAETDADAPDVVEYTGEKRTVAGDPSVSRDELQSLYAKYLGGEEKPAEAPVGESSEKTDVEKNIDEAEKYIDAIITGERQSVRDPNAAIPTVETSAFMPSPDVTDNIDAYAPEVTSEEPKEKRRSEKKHGKHEKNEAEPAPESAGDVPTDTAMLKAFGLHPKREITEETSRIFSSFGFTGTAELQSTEEISSRELEGEDAPPVAPEENEPKGFEYADPAQNTAIGAALDKRLKTARTKMALAGFLALLLLLLENISAVGEWFGRSRDIFVAADWMLLFLCAILVADPLFVAAKQLAKFKFTPDTVTLAAFFLSVVTTLITAFSAPAYVIPRMYSFGFAVCVLLSTVASYISLRRDMNTFKILSSKKVLKTLTVADKETERVPESAEFVDYLSPDSDVASVRKTAFVSDFFARRRELPRSMFAMNFFVPASFGVALLVFFLAKFAVALTTAESAGAAYATFLMCAPFAAFLSYTYPMFLASNIASDNHSALVGDCTPEDYTNTAVVAFRDEDAFPAGKLRMSSMRIYADRNIASAMYYASSVFSKIGGPLAGAFKSATLNSVVSQDVEIREIASEGVCATVDGKSIVVGRPSYMDKQCFETLPDAGDEEYEGKTNKRILYLACEQIIIAKFYIQYNTTSDFLRIVRRLTNAGICVSIRTADPCIDDGILYGDKRFECERRPLKIIKGIPVEETEERISAKRGGVVTIGTSKDLVRALMLSKKVGDVGKTTLVLKTVASIIGFAVMLLLLFTGKTPEFLSLFPALYQGFWLLPTLCVSLLYI